MEASIKKAPRLLLVGAGPGDEELITIKGVKALQQANVVLYDALANEALLDLYAPTAKRMFVGKRKGLHHVQQYYINKTIVAQAKKYGTVVRLKGGDPFVFGRGFEEMKYALTHGLEVEYVPGVSSAFAVAPLAGIPLTIRGVNACFTVVTATRSDGKLTRELRWAVSGRGTVVILMGMNKLQEIAKLVEEERGAAEMIAVLSKGSCSDAAEVFAPAMDIYRQVLDKNLPTPAIIVVGKVVEEAYRLLNRRAEENTLLHDKHR